MKFTDNGDISDLGVNLRQSVDTGDLAVKFRQSRDSEPGGKLRQSRESDFERKLRQSGDVYDSSVNFKQSVDNDFAGGKYKQSGDISDEILMIESGKVIGPLKRKAFIVTPASFARLEGKVMTIQGQLEALSVYTLPRDEAILEAARTQHGAEPVRNLLQGLNITKRMSGAEEGIDKLASLIETMAKEYGDLKSVLDKLEAELGQNLVKTIKELKTAAHYAISLQTKVEQDCTTPYRRKGLVLRRKPHYRFKRSKDYPFQIPPKPYHKKKKRKTYAHDNSGEIRGRKVSESISAEEGEEQEIVQKIKKKRHHRASTRKTLNQEYAKELREIVNNLIEPRVDNIMRDRYYLLKNIEYLNAKLDTHAFYLEGIIGTLHSEGKYEDIKLDERFNLALQRNKEDERKKMKRNLKKYKKIAALDKRLTSLEYWFSNNTQKIKNVMGSFYKDLLETTSRLDDLEENRSKLTSKNKDSIQQQATSDGQFDNKMIKVFLLLLRKFHTLRNIVNNMKYSLQSELHFNKKEDQTIEDCLQQVETLKKLKADKYEVDESLATKADCDMLKQKVSIDQFEVICNDFAQGIEDTINRISTQEDMMKMIFNEVHATLIKKCDQEEIEIFRDEFLKKLAIIQNDIANMTPVKPGRIAAGAKQKLSPMNCVSCDREVFMRTENAQPIAAITELPPSHSIRPFISYQLDQLRKLMLKNPNERSIFIFEEALKRYRIKNDLQNNAAYVTGVKNRYVGGKHTTLRKTKLDCNSVRPN